MSRLRYLLLFLVATLVCTGIGVYRLHIDTDVIRSLPANDTIITNGLSVFEHHPLQDQIAIDVMYEGQDPDLLAAVCTMLEQHLTDSGLFAQVGSSDYAQLIPGLATTIAKNLPQLFTAAELREQVAPLVHPASIEQRIAKLHSDLASMEGMGQARFIALDPLGFKDLVMARLAPLAPTLNARIYKGRLLSTDRQHMLVTARPLANGTDTSSARQLTEHIQQAAQAVQHTFSSDKKITLTPVGAFRAALDNERIIRHDVNRALLLATAGICLLLFISFPRPLIGMLSLLPAFAGMGIALCVYSLFHDSISIMVLGFGSAIISITVDHGVTYLLFLDRKKQTTGNEASREVRSVGIMAVITSIGAFLLLSCGNFPIFTELGQFTALGIFFSYVIVHWIFPAVFPALKPLSRRTQPLRSFIDRLYHTGKFGSITTAVLALGLLCFARPEFHVSLSSMNTVSEATMEADSLFSSVWGNMDQQIFFMHTAPTFAQLQNHNDRVLEMVEADRGNNQLESTFVPSMVFPGKDRAEKNLHAWENFWTQEKIQEVTTTLRRVSANYGFTADAFTEFTKLLHPGNAVQVQPIPAEYYQMLGITKQEKGYGQYINLHPGTTYDSAAIFSRYSQEGSLFDTNLFTSHLAELLFSTFRFLFFAIACSVALLLFLFYLDIRLTLLTLLPPAFSYICTLGTLHLLGRPLDIPSLMLSIVILGMGVDYSIFCARAHQRYRDSSHPSYSLVRLAVFIAGTSTMIGFGVLCLAEHSLLKSIGITSLLGIGYSLVGTFFLLPPLLEAYLRPSPSFTGRKAATAEQRVDRRYRTLEAYPRQFAHWKMRFDPICRDLSGFLAREQNIRTIVDIGCGYGVPACWCLEQYPQAKVYALDPDPERVRVASFAFQDRGKAIRGFAPDLPQIPGKADCILLLDMLHYLDEQCLKQLLTNCRHILRDHGILAIRFVIRPQGKRSWSWHLEDIRIRLHGGQAHYRSREHIADLCKQAGLTVSVSEVSGNNPELIWIICEAIN
ncbi:MMPL family transporter [Desulfogranum japonicum]|uniref:MMPL family transporter n=1 Tax=Desulfogranum japonicum TaxID=231447 RepID=UPI0004046B0A|nr:MMPL family transporter [Desulfogranum japonicum]